MDPTVLGLSDQGFLTESFEPDSNALNPKVWSQYVECQAFNTFTSGVEHWPQSQSFEEKPAMTPPE